MGCGHGRVGHSEHVGTSAVLTPAVNGREAAEDPVRIGDGSKRPNREGLREQPLPKLIGFSDRTQGRVQQRHAVAQAFGLLEAVRGQEDRHPALTEPVDQIVHLPGGGRVQARSGLVEKDHVCIFVEQSPGKTDPLAQTFGQLAAGLVGPLGEVDRSQDAIDALASIRQPGQAGEALQVLGHG